MAFTLYLLMRMIVLNYLLNNYMLKILSLGILIVFLIGCQTEQIKFPETSEIVGLASPIYIGLQETEVNLEDYFLNFDHLFILFWLKLVEYRIILA